MWRNQFEAGFRLSHQGKYLYSGWDMLDGNPLIVIDADSGAILWQRRMQMYWEQLLDEDTLVTVDQSGFIHLFEMKSGRTLLERDIGAAFSDELSHVTLVAFRLRRW
ncbi:MAG: hypothetical protein ACE5IR_07685 [bacterium]